MVRLTLLMGMIVLTKGVAASQTLTVTDRENGAAVLEDLEHADGTLPLRLPGDGTLPLRMNGSAINITNGSAIATSVNLTRAERRAMTPAQGAQLACQQTASTVSKHVAAGTVSVGPNFFVIKGICYNHADKNMEIVASSDGGDKSFMVGKLLSEQPSNLAGKLFIEGGNQTVRYSYDVRTSNR